MMLCIRDSATALRCGFGFLRFALGADQSSIFGAGYDILDWEGHRRGFAVEHGDGYGGMGGEVVVHDPLPAVARRFVERAP